ncbi:hypothetical protein ABIA39_001262 [Nocardia sp. GAS34]|uniref:hypothetical protein n=1 Tax=unclassified Nocardia TaxID=2637762 RepID=UPI003D1F359E
MESNRTDEYETDGWSNAELAVLEAIRRGETLDLGSGESLNEPLSEARHWGADRIVRASVLTQLILSPPKHDENVPLRITLAGARVTGTLDLGCGDLAPFNFTRCAFDERPNLNDANASFVGFVGCRLPGLSAKRLKCEGAIWLDKLESSSEVSFEDAEIFSLSARQAEVSDSAASHAVCLCGARILHDLNISGIISNGSIGANTTRVGGNFSLGDAKLSASKGYALSARLLRTGGSLNFGEKFQSTGSIHLDGAEIGGSVNMVRVTISGDGGNAVDLDHAVVKHGIHARFAHLKGSLSFHHATISCQVNLGGAQLDGDRGDSIRADHAFVDGTLLLNNNMTAKGSIYLHGARVECNVNIDTLKLTTDDNRRVGISADHIEIGGDLLAKDVDIRGGMDLQAATISGGIFMRNGHWVPPAQGAALALDRMTASGIAAGGLKCEGVISMSEAQLNGPVDFSESTIGSVSQKSISLGGAKIDGPFIADRAIFNGAFDAPNCNFRGDLRLADATLNGTPAHGASLGTPADRRYRGHWRGTSVRLTGTSVLGDVDLRSATLTQSLVVNSMEIGRTLDITRATLSGRDVPALVADNIHAATLKFSPSSMPLGEVRIDNGSVETLEDDLAAWPKEGKSNIEGLTYTKLASSTTTNDRINWLLDATPKFSPQPYEQLASIYASQGLLDDERDVRLAAARRAYEGRRLPTRIWGMVQDILIGFGYRPVRVLIWACAMWIIGALLLKFGTGHCNVGGIIQSGLCPVRASDHPTWNPFLYSLDLLLPFSSFGQVNSWRTGGLSMVVSVVLRVGGWLLVTTVAAAIARSIRR